MSPCWYAPHLFQVRRAVGVHERVVDALRKAIGDEVGDHQSHTKGQAEVVLPGQLEDNYRCANGSRHSRGKRRGPDECKFPRLLVARQSSGKGEQGGD